MSDNPDVIAIATQARKSCWNCPSTIKYERGWCEECWSALGVNRQNIVLNTTMINDNTLRGTVFLAVVDSLNRERRPLANDFDLSQLVITL